MRQPLWEVPEERTRLRIDLLGVEPNVVRQLHQSVHQRSGLVEPPGLGEHLHQPERTAQERSFAAAQAVLAEIPIEVWTVAELAYERIDRARQPVIARVDVAEPRAQQHARSRRGPRRPPLGCSCASPSTSTVPR